MSSLLSPEVMFVGLLLEERKIVIDGKTDEGREFQRRETGWKETVTKTANV